MFRDEPLREVADRFNRSNALRLRVSDDAGALRLTGNLRADDLASLRAFLDEQPTLAVSADAREIRVRSRRRACPRTRPRASSTASPASTTTCAPATSSR